LRLLGTILASTIVLCTVAQAQTNIADKATAWSDGSFHIDPAGVVARSAIVLQRPNLEASEAMPLGNGHLGVAAWSQEGFTAQLNRADGMPGRLSAGQVVISGVARLVQARDYSGQLDLYRGELREHGGGMTLTAFVEPDKDVLVIEVNGADPEIEQTAELRLWEPRKPHAGAQGGAAWLADGWLDDKNPGATGKPFGTLAAITADARDVSATVAGPLSVAVRFRPDATGHFRVLVAAPHFDGSGDAALSSKLILQQQAREQADSATHAAWWAAFWNRAGLMRITSADGAGEYMENLRTIYLYVAACERGEEWPGSQAGVADMISAARDEHKWDPSAFWHWNLRMQVAANLGAGLSELNDSYFRLYRDNLKNIETWTQKHMNGSLGVCVPETMRFNGQGIEYEGQWTPVSTGLDCAMDSRPYYNARTLSTGAEISLWIWQQYLATEDRAFLEQNYPVMAESARFLLASQKPGPDGLLHTSPSNAHETQWDVTDPTTDIAGIRALYPVVIEAARLLARDKELTSALTAALKRTPDFPRVTPEKPPKLLSRAEDSNAQDVIGESHEPGAPDHNVENIGLEPVWPYNLIGDRSPEFALARRTYERRPFPISADWSYDPIHAARLGLGGEVAATLTALTKKFQNYPNGMAKWSSEDKEFYIEQTGVVAAALEEALVQDFDELIRIAPAVPPGWDFDGSVWVRDRTRVNVQTRNGRPETVVIDSGAAQTIRLRNPWPGQSVIVSDGESGSPVSVRIEGEDLRFDVSAGKHYRVQPQSEKPVKFQPVTGETAKSPKKLGPVAIGLFASQPAR
jgi:alpha-L-fucosidase 2